MILDRKIQTNRLPDPRGDEFTSALRSHLVLHGLLDEMAAARVERACRQSKERFDVVASRLGLIGEAALCRAMAELLSLPLAGPMDWPDLPVFPDIVPETFLVTNRMVLLAEDGTSAKVAIADPFNSAALDALAFQIERPVHISLAAAGDIERCLERLYGRTSPADPVTSITAATSSDEASIEDVRRLEDLASEAPIIRLVHDLIIRAVESRASDIHIEPRDDCVWVRYRIDGALKTVETLPVTVRAALSSRVKIMAHLNIAERRLPQDGRIKFTVRGREIDLRISTMPTMTGESVVLRILDRESIPLDFPALGFAGRELEAFERLLAEPNGIILVTGPTGSGKSTTLYTALKALNRTDRKLFTVEDPIEYKLAGVNQIAVNPRIGLSFASALRSILRQDPDIIMIGEIRDLETAEIAIRASLTGHLVLSTVHTNSAAGTITRLLDMGVEDYLLASTLKGVLAQRLVRRLCPDCSVAAPVSAADAERLRRLSGRASPAASMQPRGASGCAHCQSTGYHGRTAIYELLTVSAGVRDHIAAGARETEIEASAVAAGMATLLQNGIGKVMSGDTSLQEVLRVTRADDAPVPL